MNRFYILISSVSVMRTDSIKSTRHLNHSLDLVDMPHQYYSARETEGSLWLSAAVNLDYLLRW